MYSYFKVYKNYHFFYFLLSALLFMFFLIYKYSGSVVEWTIYNMGDVSLSLSLNFSMPNIIFTFTVSSVFASVYYYSMSYMEGEFYVKRFMLILTMFMSSMMILIMSGNAFTSLIGWDGLGVTSLMLIMFYSSESSLKASMHAFIINRLGDCFFLIFIFYMMCNFPSLSNFNHEFIFPSILGSMLVLLSITKSAQMPFSSWLTKAMEAPTPVSSLVHSSTLVTAGIYMLFIYKNLWTESDIFIFFLQTVSLTTLFMASLAGLVEMDLKKIIAYSTLSQLGFIMFIFSLKLFNQGFFYLIMHAFFKAMMFMAAGHIIHNSAGWQDIRLITLNYSCSPSMMKIMVMASCSLCGMPFLAGFFSKDLVVDALLSLPYPSVWGVILLLAFLMTTFYTLRLCWFLSKGLKSLSCMIDDSKMLMSMIYLYSLSCMMGSILLWTLPNFQESSPCDSPKLVLITFLIIMGMIFWNFKNMNYSMFFLKSNFYLYICISLFVSNFTKVMSFLFWHADLMNIMGAELKKISSYSFLISEWEGDHWSMIYEFKDFVLFSVVCVSLYVYWFF